MKSVLLAAIAAAGYLVATAAQAQTSYVNFEMNPTGTAVPGTFSFTNNGDGTASFGTTGALDGVLTTFDVTPFAIPVLPANLPATLTLSGTASAPVEKFVKWAENVAVQPLDGGDLSIDLDTPINGLSNVLTVHFTGGALLTFPDFIGGSVSFESNPRILPLFDPGSVSVTSDFYNFGPHPQFGGGLQFDDFRGSAVGPDGLFQSQMGGVRSFSIESIPETSIWWGLVSGFAAIGARLRRGGSCARSWRLTPPARPCS